MLARIKRLFLSLYHIMLATKEVLGQYLWFGSTHMMCSQGDLPEVWTQRGSWADWGNFASLLEEHTAWDQLYNFLPLSGCHQTSFPVTLGLPITQSSATTSLYPEAIRPTPAALPHQNPGAALSAEIPEAHSWCLLAFPTEVAIHRHGLLSHLATLEISA